ncbi:MAG: hypothetical protein A2599_02685 [Candidatus Staskawiczbacteria bacterium RIFOXYD1_FULL_39_28]|uniref:Uncharacterized protein n=1 Tax=Candidatus Staskawiczbacteria bacterium RIFOXYC1_FULL_38_18 TaxID=1802229 RepID=A0A1G2JC30_9BACT|nr:MAG: hypothetical protein A2401_01185 [Candidatus Staskawiczbacteria bacterium RIFOXYC1_FULL_38_18]OGZ91017.1 MAG: hypothetical protein A2599_02685 [Candidatus Staskawiczbacteria bacterium RIFOXYD1_FULL_39_28]
MLTCWFFVIIKIVLLVKLKNMETANFLSAILGLFLVFIPLSLLMNPKKIKTLFSAMENDVTAYTCGVVSFVLGSATVLLNNVWAYDWRTLITIFGWILIIRGLVLMFWQEGALMFIRKIKDKERLSYALLAAVFLGLILVYFGFVGK